MSNTTLPPIVYGAVAVIERQGRVLIARRPRGTHLAGLWEFPGGKRRRGESAAACLRRELREELGVTVRVGASLGELRYDYPERRVRLAVRRCSIVGGRPRAPRDALIRWVPLGRLAQHEFPPANAPLLRRLSPDGCPIC